MKSCFVFISITPLDIMYTRGPNIMFTILLYYIFLFAFSIYFDDEKRKKP